MQGPREEAGQVEVLATLDEGMEIEQLRRSERVMAAFQLRYVEHFTYTEAKRILSKQFGVHRSKAEAYVNLAKKVWIAEVRRELPNLPAEQLAEFLRSIARIEKRITDIDADIEDARRARDRDAVAALHREARACEAEIRKQRTEINRMFGLHAPKKLELDATVKVGVLVLPDIAPPRGDGA